MHRFSKTALCGIALALSAHAATPDGDTWRIESAVIAGGGATLGGGTYRLSGTVGQPATARLAAGTYRIYDGFWSPRISASDLIFADGFDP
jgi:hypothetical protein